MKITRSEIFLSIFISFQWGLEHWDSSNKARN